MADVDVVDDDVADVLKRNAAAAGDLDIRAATVDGFEAVDNELVLELDEHVAREDDPEGFGLDHAVAKCAWSWVCWVVIGGVGDDVDLAAFAAEGCVAESDGAVGESLAVVGPVWVAPPAIVDWVSGEARELVFGAAIVGGGGGG